MTVRGFTSQPEKVESLPIISESAVVTDVVALDRDRRTEIRERLRTLASRHGFEGEIPRDGEIDWSAVFTAATAKQRRLAPVIGALRDRYLREHPALVKVVFESEQPFDFAAGQYLSVRYGGRTRAYSIASSPTADATELCIRRVPDGRLSVRLCDELEPGDRLAIRGPSGDLLLEDPSDRDLVFLATGTGVAPMKSMIDYTFATGRDTFAGQKRDVWLFLGAAWKDDLPYHDQFTAMADEHDHFHYVPCLSREAWLSRWHGETDYVQDVLMKHVDERALEDAVFGYHMAEMMEDRPERDEPIGIDPHAVEVYACGLNAMVFGMETAVTRLGVPSHRIHAEGYG